MDCYIGMITTFAFNWAPLYFAACNGQSIPVTQNQALYALIGNTFGGNTQNFNVPDLQGRAPVHFGTASGGSTNRAFGVKFGTENVTVSAAQVPAHTHALNETTVGQTVTATTTATMYASDQQGNVNKPSSTAYLAKAWDAVASTVTSCYRADHNVTMASDAIQVTVTPTFNKTNLTIGATGNGAAVPVATPSLALNFCICTSGLFPTRT